MKEIEEIVRTEILRLHAKQQSQSLEIVDVKQLVELSRAWKYLHETPPPKEGGSVDHLSLDELRQLAMEDEAKSTEQPSSKT